MDPYQQNTTESLSAIAAKVGPPASVSLATIAGYNVSELILWATLIYTVLMIGGKLYSLHNEIKDRIRLKIRRHMEKKYGREDTDGTED